ncbi:hypothetical protein ACJTCM_05145 [Bacillus cereus]|uniref:YunG family protein n=1 Tax=Bacillus cereus TaxID=1396 RepID=UPI00396E3AA3
MTRQERILQLPFFENKRELAGQRFDFTETQFNGKLNYMDEKSNREEAFADTNEKQYNILKGKITKELKLSFDS